MVPQPTQGFKFMGVQWRDRLQSGSELDRNIAEFLASRAIETAQFQQRQCIDI